MRSGNSSNGCPNCNVKAARRDIRIHFVSRLKAIDTSERDRAVDELEKCKREKRELELEAIKLKVCHLFGCQCRNALWTILNFD